MESIVSGAANKVVEYTFGVIKRGFCYIIYVDSNVQNLKMQVQKLIDARASVQQDVYKAQRNADEIFHHVNRWLTEVNEKIAEQAATQSKEDEEKATKKCFVGLFPNLKSRYQLSKKAEEEAQAIIQLLGEGKFEKVSYSVAPEGIVIKGYKAFESRTSAMEGIMEALRESSVRIVGVHGMAGVGKTTLAKEVASKVREEHLFDEVAMAMVSHNPVIRQIQGEIADMLGLKFDVETDSGRAMQLRQRLKNGKRILIILDDLWQKLDLEAVGISFDNEAARKSSTAGCKILLTSRGLDVLRLMDAERSFEVKILSQEESMILFAKIVGDAVGKSDDYQRVADELVKKCAGLPVAILAIANTLKTRDLYFWEDALRQLQRSIPSNIKGLQDNVYSTIELSYRWLSNEEEQSVFLLCGLHPQGFDILVSDLLQYSIGLDLLEGINTVEEARKRIDVLVHELKASSLLLEGKGDKWVKMHDLIRDVSLSIASKDKRMLVIEDESRMKELLKKGKLNDCTAISLPYSNIHELSGVECSKLELLMLLNEDSSFQISDTFFEGMNELKVLNVTGMSFPSLPSSFLSLTNLQTLRLYQCNLSEIAIIRNLKKLDILSFQGSSIKQLPVEIAELTELRLLDLSECSSLKVIPANVIPKLSRLEELYVGKSFGQWNVKGNAQLAELKNLSCLSALHVYIPDAKIMPKDLFSVKLERYKIAIGNFDWDSFECEASKALQLKLNTGIHLDEGIKMLVEKTEELGIEEFKGAENVLYGLDREGFPHLKHLSVVNSSEMKCIIKSMGSAPHKAFPVLESLKLSSLTVLEKICDGQLKTASFSRLRTIQVRWCDRLKNLFSVSIAKNLYQLQQISVKWCENIKEIVVEEEGKEDNVVEFRQLRSLELEDLPELKSSYSMEETPSSRGQGGSVSTTNMVPLFNRKVIFPVIKELVLRSMNSIGKLWDDQLLTDVMFFGFQMLTILSVYSCHKLKYVFTSSMVKSFVQLKTLDVGNCEEMEKVIAVSAEKERNNIMVFPKLDSLHLYDLPNLKRFCCGINPIEFPVLRRLEIEKCPVLSTFHCDSSTNDGKSNNSISMGHNLRIDVPHCLFNDKVVFPVIKELVLESMSSIEKLWDDQLPVAEMSFGFQNLTILEVLRCQKLKYVCTSSIVKSFVQLKTLYVGNCEEMEEVIAISAEEKRNNIVVFPKLDLLFLFNLPNLKRFCCGINSIEFPFLRNFSISRCPILSTLHCDSSTTVGNEARKSSSSSSSISIPKYLFDEKVALPMLQHLQICSMKNLERLWPNQLAEQSFSKLSYFELECCDKLMNVFPLSMLTRLKRLEKLIIWECELVEEIFESQQTAVSSVVATFEFPRLTSLDLVRLPRLKSFYHNMHFTNWPSLKEMHVSECGKVEILFGFQETGGGKSEHELKPIQRPLFWVDKFTFPTLQQLSLGWNDGMKEIWHCSAQHQLLASHYFSKLKVVTLYDLPKQLAIFPSYLLHLLYFPNLETLEIERAYFKEIFPSEGVGEEKPTSACLLLSRLTELRLKDLPELMHLWKEKERCPKLKYNLVPSSVSFHNLVTLEVQGCDGIIKLVAYSTAKSLVQLKEMKICLCENIEEIIQGSGDDEDEVKDEISFPQLNLLELIGLSKLESFCSSGNYTFGFPSLVTVILENCPKMKMFSQGDSNTPFLHKVLLQKWENDERWEGNLNSTIRQLFKEKNSTIEEVQNYIEDQDNLSASNTQ